MPLFRYLLSRISEICWRTSSPTYSMIMSSLLMFSIAYSPQLWIADRANLTGFLRFLSWLNLNTSESWPSVFFWSFRSATKRRLLARLALELPLASSFSAAILAASAAAAAASLPSFLTLACLSSLAF